MKGLCCHSVCPREVTNYERYSHIEVFQAVCQFGPLRAAQPRRTIKAENKQRVIEEHEEWVSEWHVVVLSVQQIATRLHLKGKLTYLIW